jgi:hypothetical protein
VEIVSNVSVSDEPPFWYWVELSAPSFLVNSTPAHQKKQPGNLSYAAKCLPSLGQETNWGKGYTPGSKLTCVMYNTACCVSDSRVINTLRGGAPDNGIGADFT